MTTRSRIIFISFMTLLMVSMACNLEDITGDDTVELETAVAATLEAITASQTDEPGNATDIPQPPVETQFPTTHPTVTAMPSPTNTPPPEGLSLNCDGTYQRVRVVDGGAAGKTVFVDNWNGATWVEVWRVEGGDPMSQQIEDTAGYYLFGECTYLVIVPILYGGSGAVIELTIYAWDGVGMIDVYRHDGVHADWEKLGNMITFEESLYLFDEPNCCPCNRQYLEHTWDGTAFQQTGSLISPTYEGDPPDHCQP